MSSAQQGAGRLLRKAAEATARAVGNGAAAAEPAAALGGHEACGKQQLWPARRPVRGAALMAALLGGSRLLQLPLPLAPARGPPQPPTASQHLPTGRSCDHSSFGSPHRPPHRPTRSLSHRSDGGAAATSTPTPPTAAHAALAAATAMPLASTAPAMPLGATAAAQAPPVSASRGLSSATEAGTAAAVAADGHPPLPAVAHDSLALSASAAVPGADVRPAPAPSAPAAAEQQEQVRYAPRRKISLQDAPGMAPSPPAHTLPPTHPATPPTPAPRQPTSHHAATAAGAVPAPLTPAAAPPSSAAAASELLRFTSGLRAYECDDVVSQLMPLLYDVTAAVPGRPPRAFVMDFETSGQSAASDSVIEIGAVDAATGAVCGPFVLHCWWCAWCQVPAGSL